jgi:hypothetical protein
MVFRLLRTSVNLPDGSPGERLEQPAGQVHWRAYLSLGDRDRVRLRVACQVLV